MQLSKRTIDIIKMFANINTNLLIEPGNVLKTISVAQNMVAFATIDEKFDDEFGIYNTPEFLAALGLFKDPEVKFSDRFAKISDKAGLYSLKYMGATKDILVYPTKYPNEPVYDLSFDLSQDQLNSILKGAAVIGAPDIQIVANDKGTAIKVYDRKNPASNDFQITINDVPGDGVFNLKVENLKLYPGDQKVSVSAKGLSRWENVAAKVIVFIALEAV